MSLRYGEGHNAFLRLQKKLNKIGPRLDPALESLPVATDAPFNSKKNESEPLCLPTTRTDLLHGIQQWADDRTDDRCIYWLSGMAGTGKSTVARTIANIYHDQGELGASFFFSKGGGEVGNADRLFTTLARQLAASAASARRYISEAVSQQPDIAQRSLRYQWETLIRGPLSKLSSYPAPRKIVMVIDALDECGSDTSIEVVLNILATARLLESVRLRILITSRPEISVRSAFSKRPVTERQVFVLHEISKTLIDRDLTQFFKSRFSNIREGRDYGDDWPGMETIERLVECSCGLFIWASTACRFIEGGKRLAARRIEKLINEHRSGKAGPEEQLDQIYTTVLQNAIAQDSSPTEKDEVCLVLKRVLGSIVVLLSPLSIDSLGRLIELPPGETFKDVLADLHTIFHIPSSTSQTLRLHHPTFRDFLLDNQRCGDPSFWVNGREAHSILADSCIDIMSEMLKRDICGLESPGTLAKDVDPDIVKQHIPPVLEYACLYWVQHVQMSGQRLCDNDRVDCFFREYFLCWVEAISLLGKTAGMTATVRLYNSLLVPECNKRQSLFVGDARRLLFTFLNVIKQAPLQIYCAAIAFLQPNELREHLLNQLHPWVRGARVAAADVPATKDESNYVNDLAFTTDGRYIASGSMGSETRLWTVATKAVACKFEGPSDKISSVAISRDGRTIAAGSDDFTVAVWDFRTRELRHMLKTHKRWVNSVAFSPDNKLLMSASMDETIALWDPESGRNLCQFSNQAGCVNSATFSPDGASIVAGSVDQMVRVWDVSGGSGELRAILDGHSGAVNSVRFSSGGKHILSGSDDLTVRVWNVARWSEILMMRGHTKKIMAVTFSPDDRLIVSGGDDKTIRVWDAATGAPLHTLRGHTSGVNAVLFSPNRQALASGCFNNEVWLWDVDSWKPQGQLEDFQDLDDDDNGFLMIEQFHDRAPSPVIELAGFTILESTSDIALPSTMIKMQDSAILAKGEFKGHSEAVTCAVFSPDGGFLATASHDGTVKLWLVEELSEHWSLTGHSAAIEHLTFSPDGLLIASASSDKTIRLWSAHSRSAHHTLEGHTDEVQLTVFSPDNRMLASLAADNSIRLWSPDTGAALATLERHRLPVGDMAFSRDSRTLASCSADANVIIWNARTAEPVALLAGHTGPVNSVAFSPDGTQLVSSSEDASTRVWDVARHETREVLGMGGHAMTCSAFSPDGQVVAYCAVDGRIKFWDAKTGSEEVMDAGIVVRTVSFSSCGRYLETDRGALAVPGRSASSSASSLANYFHRLPLFVSHDWVQREREKAVWLPEEYHARCVANFGELVVLGHESGAISFLRVH
ncbi:hypothetical protein RB601_002033 [Gaeumannomyces tritici]